MAVEDDGRLKFEGLRFLDSDLEKLTSGKGGYEIETLEGESLTELVAKGLDVEINDERLRVELLAESAERAHKNMVAYHRKSGQIILEDSRNYPINQQDRMVVAEAKRITRELDLDHVWGGISRLTDWATIVLKHYQKSGEALFKPDDPYIITRTGALEYIYKGVEDAVAIFKQVGPNKIIIATQPRDYGDFEVAAVPLLFPKMVK